MKNVLACGLDFCDNAMSIELDQYIKEVVLKRGQQQTLLGYRQNKKIITVDEQVQAMMATCPTIVRALLSLVSSKSFCGATMQAKNRQYAQEIQSGKYTYSELFVAKDYASLASAQNHMNDRERHLCNTYERNVKHLERLVGTVVNPSLHGHLYTSCAALQ